jgi:hypothetical protein
MDTNNPDFGDTSLQAIKEMKMLAHRFDLAGTIDVFAQNRSVSVELEGFLKQITNKESFLSFKEFVETFAQDSSPVDKTVFEYTLESLAFSNQPGLNGKMIMDRYHEITATGTPKTISVLSGWDHHAVGIVIHGNKLYLCNRGQGSDGEHGIVEYAITKPANLNEALVNHLLDASGSPHFLQVELKEQLGLTEIARYDAPPLTVGNCAWANALENIHATLLAQYSEKTSDTPKAQSLADAAYDHWFTFDLNKSLAHLPHFENDPLQHDMINEVLGKILSYQHDATDQNQIQRALYILPHLEDPLNQLKNLHDPIFEKNVSDRMQEYIDIYDNSHWYDSYYFKVDGFLDTFNLGYTEDTYEKYAQDVHLGQELATLRLGHTDLVTSSSTALSPTAAAPMRWEDVFPQGSGMFCHNKFTPVNAPQSIIEPIQSLPEYVHGLI